MYIEDQLSEYPVSLFYFPILDEEETLMNLPIIKQVDFYKVPTVDFILPQFPGMKLQALLDTGAAMNLINATYIHLFSESKGTINIAHPMEGVPKEQPAYEIEFRIENWKVKFKDKFAAIKGFKYPVVLGCPFLSQCKAFKFFGPEGKFELVYE